MKTKLTLKDLPSEKLPDFWNDDTRLNALYAPFRDRSVNSRDWDSKLIFWKGIIENWCDFTKIGTFTENELKQSFIHNGRTPACLSAVLNEMFRTGEIITLDQFLITPQKSWTGWAFDIIVRKPVSWSFSKIKNTLMSPTNADTVFVHTSSMKKQSEKLFLSVPEKYRNRVMTLKEFTDVCNLLDIDTETIKLLLHSLKCQNKIDTIMYEKENINENVLMVKVAPLDGKLEPITNVDMSKWALEDNEKQLVQKIEQLETEKNTALENTKLYLKKGMKQMAKSWLRKEHELTKHIEKQISVLDNVQSLLTRIGTAESDGKVLQSYKYGLDALKTVFKDTGLSEDGVADTMADLEGVLDSHDDIQASLSQSLNPALDAELEQELAELLAEPSDENPMNPTSPGGQHDKEKGTEDNLDELKKLPVVEETSVLSDEEQLMRRLAALKMPSTPPESSSSRDKNVILS